MKLKNSSKSKHKNRLNLKITAYEWIDHQIHLNILYGNMKSYLHMRHHYYMLNLCACLFLSGDKPFCKIIGIKNGEEKNAFRKVPHENYPITH